MISSVSPVTGQADISPSLTTDSYIMTMSLKCFNRQTDGRTDKHKTSASLKAPIHYLGLSLINWSDNGGSGDDTVVNSQNSQKDVDRDEQY